MIVNVKSVVLILIMFGLKTDKRKPEIFIILYLVLRKTENKKVTKTGSKFLMLLI